MSWRLLEQVSVGWPTSPSKPHFGTFEIPSASKLRFSRHSTDVFLSLKSVKNINILRREDPTSNVVAHQYMRHSFNARELPTCANFSLQKTASDHQAEYAEAASAIVQKLNLEDT